MENLIDTLAKRLEEARELSVGFEQKARTLQYFEGGEDKEDAQRDIKEGHLPRLAELIEGIGKVNSRNRTTLEHINKLL